MIAAPCRSPAPDSALTKSSPRSAPAAWARCITRDTRLIREVAVKVLPEAVATDLDRLARFTREAQREAQTLAALNHPHIAQIHGLEESGSTRALVMELVEGEDLSIHSARGPLPLTEALAIAAQIADALAAAHDIGIVHLDLRS